MESLVSVIIPMYNSESNIELLIKNLKEQTYSNFEVILIDDFSSDKTVEICKENMDKRFKLLLNKENKGVSVSRNIGIENSNGNFIVFIDSDDEIFENTIELLVKNIENVDFAIGNYKYKNGLENIILNSKIDSDIFDIQSKILIDNTENRKSVSNPRSVWGKIYKAEIIKNNNIRFIPNLKLFEDGLFNLEYLMYVKKYKIFKSIIYVYNITNDSAVNRFYNDLYFQDTLRINSLENLLNKFNKKEELEKYENIIVFEFFIRIYD